jgi:hypothetical protein
MNQERELQEDRKPSSPETAGEGKHQHPSPFKEASGSEGENTESPQEESKLEQERKEAMTERD